MLDRQDAAKVFIEAQTDSISVQETIQRQIELILASLPDPACLSRDERRGIIARYTAVLEGNFIYWMTATELSVSSREARRIIRENLIEEVRDNHPGMLRRFSIAARAFPTDSDHFAIHQRLQEVRSFVSGLPAMQLVLMMAFFEGFIGKFMPYLADVAVKQGSRECQYTNVHSVVDLDHTQQLYQAFAAEISASSEAVSLTSLLDGVKVLQRLIETVIGAHSA